MFKNGLYKQYNGNIVLKLAGTFLNKYFKEKL